MQELKAPETFFQKIQKTYQTYRQLTAYQRKIIQESHIHQTFRLTTWHDVLKKLVTFDSYADQIRGRIGTIAGAIGALTFFFSVFGLVIGFIEEEFLLYLTLAGNILILPFWLSGAVVYFLLKRLDIPNSLRLFVVPLLEKLSPEINRQTRIKMQVYLRKKARKNPSL